MKVLRYSEYSNSVKIAEEFIDTIGNISLNESGESSYKEVLSNIVTDLKINTKMILTFGVGLECMFPVVRKLVQNMSLNIDLTPEAVVLMTIAAVTIAYLEENKESEDEKKIKDNKIFEKDAKSMLEELKLKGVGNGVVKKLVKCIKSIGNIFKLLFKHKRHIFNGFFDMFGYAALIVPVINAILYMIGKYEFNIDTLPSNFLSLGLGITTISAKHGINYLIDKLKDKLGLSKKDILKYINDVDDPILQKYPHPEFIDTEYSNIKDKNKLIKEHD